MNVSVDGLQVNRPRVTKLGATPKLDIHEWPVLIKMLQARSRLEKEAPPGEYTRLITEAWNILLKELPSGNKETRRRLKKHAGNPNFIVKDDGKHDDFPHGPQIFLVSQTHDGMGQSEKLFVPAWHVDKVLNANHPYNTTYIQGRQMHTGGEALFALISEQYYGVSRKRCQQWVNECPICRAARDQGVPYGSTGKYQTVSSPLKSSRKYPYGVDTGISAPKRIKADSKTPFVVSVDKAEKRMRPFTVETPVTRSEFYSYRINAAVYFKCENFQVSGSFKARGVFNRLMVEKERMKKGITPIFTTATSDNHLEALVHALAALNMGGKIFAPTTISPTRLEKLRISVHEIGYGQRIIIDIIGNNYIETQMFATEQASMTKGVTYVPTHNDPETICGHGSIIPEMLRQIRKSDDRKIDYIIVPVGKGELIASVSTYFKDIAPYTNDDAKIIGVSPENNSPLIDAIRGTGFREPMGTISNETTGPLDMEREPVPINVCQKFVDHWVTVSEEEIEIAILEMLQQNQIIEGSAALTIAALCKEKERLEGKTVVAVLSGSNLEPEVISCLLKKYQTK